ncbi:prephenate dehydrogenase/arogenate dehydrogenase family protein [Alphaproteobacteria bacterium]|nr:prephenate dehydrogenase/arogenate dehydrogenase family protein [Alphaproteobacteria bacterium]
MSKVNFNSILIIGVGLIGSSIARAVKEYKISNYVYALDTNDNNIKTCETLNLITRGSTKLLNFDEQFELIIICSPLSTYKKIFSDLNSYVKKETLVTDVGSTKMSVIHDFKENTKNLFINFVPSHPIAGLEKSGPDFGFAKLFSNRFCILTPNNNSEKTVKIISDFWNALGMQTQIMDAEHHDRILAMTSHIPQLIAYSIVSTATELETHLKDEVIKYSAAGFRDFTRLAGSDPIMWRDVYSKNKKAVLEMLGRFTEDLSTLQKAIRNDDLSFLENTFNTTREIRKTIEDLGQAGNFDPTEAKRIK